MVKLINIYFKESKENNSDLNNLLEQEKFLNYVRNNMFNIKDFFDSYVTNKFPCNLNEEDVQSDFIKSLILNYFGVKDGFKSPTELFKKYRNSYVTVNEIETLNVGLFVSENPIDK